MRGRRPKVATPGARITLGINVSYDLKNQLHQAALVTGRSQSAEAEARLIKSFYQDEVLAILRRIADILEKS